MSRTMLRTIFMALLASLLYVSPISAANKVNFCGGAQGDIPLLNQTTRMIAIWCDGSPAGGLSFGPIASGWNVIGMANFNGVGTTDIMLYNFSTAQISIWPEGNASIGTVTGTVNTGAGYTYLTSFGDFNGDGKDDLIVWSSTTSTVAIWPSGNANSGAVLGNLAPGWQPHLVADVNGDGVADLVLRETQSGVNAGSGRYSYWLGGNPSLSSFLGSPGQPWEVMALGNFVQGAPACDVLWYNSVTGDLATSVGCGAQMGTFSIVGVLGWPLFPFMAEDISGDGVADIVSVHFNTSALSRMSGGVTSTSTFLTPYNSVDTWTPIFPYKVWYH